MYIYIYAKHRTTEQHICVSHVIAKNVQSVCNIFRIVMYIQVCIHIYIYMYLLYVYIYIYVYWVIDCIIALARAAQAKSRQSTANCRKQVRMADATWMGGTTDRQQTASTKTAMQMQAHRSVPVCKNCSVRTCCRAEGICVGRFPIPKLPYSGSHPILSHRDMIPAAQCPVPPKRNSRRERTRPERRNTSTVNQEDGPT